MPFVVLGALAVCLVIGIRRGQARKRYAPPAVTNPSGARVCGRCGGASLTARRSKGAKVGLGLLSLATPKTRLVCDQCGNEMQP